VGVLGKGITSSTIKVPGAGVKAHVKNQHKNNKGEGQGTEVVCTMGDLPKGYGTGGNYSAGRKYEDGK